MNKFVKIDYKLDETQGEKCPSCGKRKLERMIGKSDIFRCGFFGEASGGCGLCFMKIKKEKEGVAVIILPKGTKVALDFGLAEGKSHINDMSLTIEEDSYIVSKKNLGKYKGK